MTDAADTSPPLLDLDLLHHLDPTLCRDLTLLFVTQAPQLVHQLELAAEAGDFRVADDLGRQLRQSCIRISAPALLALVDQLDAAIGERNLAQFRDVVTDAVRVCAQTASELETLTPSIGRRS